MSYVKIKEAQTVQYKANSNKTTIYIVVKNGKISRQKQTT